MLTCIPYLPEYEIKRGFEYVREQAEKIKNLTPSERRNLDLFISYVKREWIDTVGPQHLSVHDRPVMATSGIESINRSMNRLLKSGKHPDFWLFLCKFLIEI